MPGQFFDIMQLPMTSDTVENGFQKYDAKRKEFIANKILNEPAQNLANLPLQQYKLMSNS